MQPFYDATKSYEENYDHGPSGAFVETPTLPALHKSPVYFLGTALDIPFGIPAGPLLNGKYIEAAWRWGYSLATYKTVRSDVQPCHPFPNILRVSTRTGQIHPGDTVVGSTDVNAIDVQRDGITNSFAVPSKAANVWQADVRNTLSKMKKGSSLILSFMGTKREGMDRNSYIQDFVLAAKQSVDTGAPIVEVNFSCPNFGKEGLVCNDVVMSRDILEALKVAVGNTPLLVKIGYFDQTQQGQFEDLMTAIQENAQGVVAINTIQAKVVNDKGEQALPGSSVRLYSGICGATIKWAGLSMAEKIVAMKKQKSWKDFVVVGVGGVTNVGDYQEYLKLGVDAVQSATGAMWKPELAMDIRTYEGGTGHV